MAWRRALTDADGGVYVDVEVVPGSRESRFPAGFNAWRGRLEAKVRAPPEDGRANVELCALVAAALDVPARDVEVASGGATRRKRLHVRGLGAAAAVARLEGRM